MSHPLTNVLFNTRHQIVTPLSSNEDNKVLVATALRNLQDLGFTIDQVGIERLQTASKSSITDWYYKTEDLLKQSIGADKEYHPFYPDFPNETMRFDDVDKFFIQIIHYISNGTITPDGDPLVGKSLEEHPIKVINTVAWDDAEKEATEAVKNLLSTKENLSTSIYNDIIMPYVENVPNWEDKILDNVTNRHNLQVLSTKAVMDGKSLDELNIDYVANDILNIAKMSLLSKDEFNFVINNPTAVANLKFKSLPSKQKKMYAKLLNKMKYLSLDVCKNKKEWKNFLHRTLHVDKYPSLKNVNKVSQDLYNNNVKSRESIIETAYNSKDVNKIIKVLANTPGLYIKNLNRMINTYPDDITKICDKLLTLDITPEDLIRAINYYNRRAEDRFFNVSGKVVYSDKTNKELSEQDKETILEVLKYKYMYQIGSKENLGKVYIDPAIKNAALPTSLRDADKIGYTSGTTFPIEKNEDGSLKNIRVFMWWTNTENRTVDLDLSCTFSYDEKFNSSDSVYYGNQRALPGVFHHSGDITNGGDVNGKGAAEFIDIDVKAAKEAGITYIKPYVNVFSGVPFAELPNAEFGVMEREELDKSANFDPKAVAFHSPLNKDCMGTTPFIIDVQNEKYIWVDQPDKNIQTCQNVTRDKLSGKYLYNNYINADLLKLGEVLDKLIPEYNIVDDITKADTVFSLNAIDGLNENQTLITATMQDKLIKEFASKSEKAEEPKLYTTDLNILLGAKKQGVEITEVLKDADIDPSEYSFKYKTDPSLELDKEDLNIEEEPIQVDEEQNFDDIEYTEETNEYVTQDDDYEL